jgi:glutamine phosphoribosylpyrophosphate amidotransferase
MKELLISYLCFSLITLFTLYWGLTFIAQVKNGQEPRIKVNLNPVQRFERKKKVVIDNENLLNNG